MGTLGSIVGKRWGKGRENSTLTNAEADKRVWSSYIDSRFSCRGGVSGEGELGEKPSVRWSGEEEKESVYVPWGVIQH